jgi:anti-anti-sigma factor
MSDGRLTIRASDEDGGSTLVLDGEVDPHTTDQLDAAVDAALGGRVVLDLSGVTFIDSAGLRSLIRAQRLAESSGGMLVLRAPRPSTMRVLEITGLTDELVIEPVVEAAD